MFRKLPVFLLTLSFSLVGCLPKVEEQQELEFSSEANVQDGNSQTSPGQLNNESFESLSLNEDSNLEIATANIPQDWDERELSNPENGAVTLNPDGMSYEPFVDYAGSDEFVVKYIKAGSVVFTQNISLTITPINDAPVAVNDSATVGSQAAITLDVLANDSDVDEDDQLTIKNVSAASNGSATIVDGKIQYQSEAAFSGMETLSYTIEDQQGVTSEASVEINVLYSSTIGSGSGLPVVPVRIAFIEKSDGSKITDDYATYAQNIIEDLNETYTDGSDQKLKFVLDIYDGVINDDYFVTSSNQIIQALEYFRNNHNISGKVNLYFVNQIVGGVAGVAYLNRIVTTTGMFEKMPTAALEKNVVGHEVGHNVGFYHTADDEISNDVMRVYTRCNPDIEYFQKQENSHGLNNNSTDGWGHGGNLMYPIASPSPSSLFTSKYDMAFSDIMACWHESSNWPVD